MYLTMNLSHIKLLHSWSARRDQQIITVLSEWIRLFREDLVQDEAFVSQFQVWVLSCGCERIEMGVGEMGVGEMGVGEMGVKWE
jgi:hypothetical protein